VGARAKRLYASDPSAPTPSQGQVGGMVPPLQPGMNIFAQNTMQQQQPSYGTQNLGQPINQGYPQPQQQQRQQRQQQQSYGSHNFGQSVNQGYAPQPHQQSNVVNRPAMPQQPPMPQQLMAQHQHRLHPNQPPVQPGSKPRIDPDQIPSPVAVQDADQAVWDEQALCHFH
jgi:protein transport protein SEC24